MIGNMFDKSTAPKKAFADRFPCSTATAGILLALASGMTACGGGDEESSADGRVTPQMLAVSTQPPYEELVTGTANCTYTQGYWKTHGPNAKGNNVNEWQFYNTAPMRLGTSNLYSAAQLQQIFDTQPSQNGLPALAHQLIAAKLNIANGADPTAIQESIAAAQTLIGILRLPPLDYTSYVAPSLTSDLVNALTAYNEGRTGPGHCG